MFVKPDPGLEFAAIRMGDIAQAGATSGLIWLYNKHTDVPDDSLRGPQIAIMGHGISVLGATLIATQTNNPKMLSKVSYPSCALFVKNCWQFYRKLNALSEKNKELDKELDRLIEGKPYVPTIDIPIKSDTDKEIANKLL